MQYKNINLPEPPEGYRRLEWGEVPDTTDVLWYSPEQFRWVSCGTKIAASYYLEAHPHQSIYATKGAVTDTAPEFMDLRIYLTGLKEWGGAEPRLFHHPVKSVAEAVVVLDALLAFASRHGGVDVEGLERYEPDDGSGKPGWCEWYDEATGSDDYREWLKGQQDGND